MQKSHHGKHRTNRLRCRTIHAGKPHAKWRFSEPLPSVHIRLEWERPLDRGADPADGLQTSRPAYRQVLNGEAWQRMTLD
jgi:hypothetical protein